MRERINGDKRPQDTITHALTSPSDCAEFKDLRAWQDAEIEEWIASTANVDLNGVSRWFPPDGSARNEIPKAECIAQLSNHQTYHRGQIHAMLTAAGAEPEPMDIPAMPKKNALEWYTPALTVVHIRKPASEASKDRPKSQPF